MAHRAFMGVGGVRCVRSTGPEPEDQRPSLRCTEALTACTGLGPPWGHGKFAVNDAKTDRQLRLYVGLVAFAGLGCLMWAVGRFPAMTPGALLYAVALTIIIASASGRLIEVRVRADHINFTSTSGAVLLAAATVPLPLTVLCTALGVLIAKAALRDPIKVTFNVTKNTIAATAAAVSAYLAGVRPPP